MQGYGFPRSVRLLTAQDFKAIFSGAKYKASTKEFLLLAIPCTSGHSRLGLVVAKKGVKKAVARNRLKRLIREQFRLNKSRLGDVDLVILTRKGADQLTNTDIVRDLEKLFRRLQRLTETIPDEGKSTGG